MNAQELAAWLKKTDPRQLVEVAVDNPYDYYEASKAMQLIPIGTRTGAQCVWMAAAAVNAFGHDAREHLRHEHPGVIDIAVRYVRSNPATAHTEQAVLWGAIERLTI